MAYYWKEHVFTAELPYEDDQPLTLFLRQHFERVDSYVMSLGQMSHIPPAKLFVYKHGHLIDKIVYVKNSLKAGGLKLYFWNIPIALIHVIWDFLKALKYINYECDIFLAQHFLPALLAIILKKLNILHSNKIVFYMFDYFLIPPEFPRSLYYIGVDSIHRYIRKHIDEIWFTTPRLAECDRERYGVLSNRVVARMTEGVFFEKVKTKTAPSLPPLRLAFLGSLRPNNAIYQSIDCVKYCLNLKMKVELVIIGSGPYEERLKKYVHENNLDKNVTFCGFVNKGKDIAHIFSKCHLGLALYNTDPYGPNWFLTSGKFRRFISQGLPVVATTSPYFIKYIYDYGAGVIVDNDPKKIAYILQQIYNNPLLLKKMKQGVDILYNSYRANKVFMDVFSNMLNI